MRGREIINNPVGEAVTTEAPSLALPLVFQQNFYVGTAAPSCPAVQVYRAACSQSRLARTPYGQLPGPGVIPSEAAFQA